MKLINKIICSIRGCKNDKEYITSKCKRCFKIIKNKNDCKTCMNLGIRWDIYSCPTCNIILVPQTLNYYGE